MPLGAAPPPLGALLNADPSVALDLEFSWEKLVDPVPEDRLGGLAGDLPLVDHSRTSPNGDEAPAARPSPEGAATPQAKADNAAYVGAVVGESVRTSGRDVRPLPRLHRAPSGARSHLCHLRMATRRSGPGRARPMTTSTVGSIDGTSRWPSRSRPGRASADASSAFPSTASCADARTYVDLLRLLGLPPTFTDAARACLDNTTAQGPQQARCSGQRAHAGGASRRFPRLFETAARSGVGEQNSMIW